MPRKAATYQEERSYIPSSILQGLDLAPELDRDDYHRKYKNLYSTRVVPKPPAEPTAADAMDEICCCGCGLSGVQHDSWPQCVDFLRDTIAELSGEPLRPLKRPATAR
jgi:hypothetical protein